MESACFISLWPINGDAITVMEMDCCCQQSGLRAGRRSFPRVVGAPNRVRENFIRSIHRIPPGVRAEAQLKALGRNAKESMLGADIRWEVTHPKAAAG